MISPIKMISWKGTPKLSKLLIIVVVFWLAAFMQYCVIQKMDFQEMTDYEKFEMNLQKFEHRDMSASAFHGWRFLKTSNENSLIAKYKAVYSESFPPGMDGKPVYLRRDMKQYLAPLVIKGWETHGFNEFISDAIPLNRTLGKDFRDPWCSQQEYSRSLPQASVVIVFHNEAWSTLLRTLNSVVNRSPEHLLKEIILYDDFSDMHHLKEQLKKYVLHYPKVTLVKAKARRGLIKARIESIEYVTAPIIVFLDSHCECTEGWLEPLIARIAREETTVVSPVVDSIHPYTFEYYPQIKEDLKIGGFNWDLKYVWQSIPPRIQKTRKNDVDPIITPTISGGLFAISKRYFAKLGYFDEGFEYWGAENLELSFKTWMCGGKLEIVPCSRVGHIFRMRSPYKIAPEDIIRNSIRLAQVWMDEYAKYFYERISHNGNDFSIDVSSRVKLRDELQCKNFSWYLKNIYPELEIPDSYAARGKIHDLIYFICFHSPILGETVKLYPCQAKGQFQFWIYTPKGQIKKGPLCLDIKFNNEPHMAICNSNLSLSQTWIFNNTIKTIQNLGSLQCLEARNVTGSWTLVMNNCEHGNIRQKWDMDNFESEKLTPELYAVAESRRISVNVTATDTKWSKTSQNNKTSYVKIFKGLSNI